LRLLLKIDGSSQNNHQQRSNRGKDKQMAKTRTDIKN